MVSRTLYAEACGVCCAEKDTGYGHGGLQGYSVAPDPRAYKVWDVLNGLGDFAFAYSFSYILLEITVSSLLCLPHCLACRQRSRGVGIMACCCSTALGSISVYAHPTCLPFPLFLLSPPFVLWDAFPQLLHLL